MKVSEAIVKCMEREGVTTVFGYPGGAILPVYEALRTSSVKHVLVRNEQAAAHMASGYARASNRTGVCLSTSGPGATNLITGIATAYMDSIPMVVITGQVKSDFIGKDVFQEADITGATAPFTKHNYLVKRAEDLPRILSEAFFIASTGRPGPVLIDIPVDVQQEHIAFEYPEKVDIAGYKPTTNGHAGQMKRIMQRIKSAKRPVIFAGGGVLRSNAEAELKSYAEKAGIPVVNTLMGMGAFPMDSPYFAGLVGTHGHEYTTKILSRADVIMVIGARLSDRAARNFAALCAKADIIHVDIDPAEIGKIVNHQIPVVGDAKNILSKLEECAERLDTDEWLMEIGTYKEPVRLSKADRENYIHPGYAIGLLSEMAASDAILVADVGQNQIWTARHFQVSGKRRFMTSGGLGTMGYSLPAALGAKLASPDKQVISVTGDGGIQMLLGELGTIAESGQALTILLLNNRRLGMVRELQDNTYGRGRQFGVYFENSPDFVQIAKAFGLQGKRVEREEDLPQALSEALNSNVPYLLECMIDPEAATL